MTVHDEPRKLQQSYQEQKTESSIDRILSSAAVVTSTIVAWSASTLFLSLIAHTIRSARFFFYLAVRVTDTLNEDFKLRNLHYDKAQRLVPSGFTLTTYFNVHTNSTLYYEVGISFSSTLLISTTRTRQSTFCFYVTARFLYVLKTRRLFANIWEIREAQKTKGMPFELVECSFYLQHTSEAIDICGKAYTTSSLSQSNSAIRIYFSKLHSTLSGSRSKMRYY